MFISQARSFPIIFYWEEEEYWIYDHEDLKGITDQWIAIKKGWVEV